MIKYFAKILILNSYQDPNQLIRASALRVLSSIRVPVIAPIMMLAIKEAVMDMSPYVRKTAAHAIPKLYRLNLKYSYILFFFNNPPSFKKAMYS